MSIETLQRNLAAKGYDPGPIDNQPGPKTYAALFSYMAGRDLGERGREFGEAAAELWPGAGITTPLRISHFLAQCSAESGQFRYVREIWGPTPAQKGYEGRADLGNCIAGDGKRFMGRGLLQITGRDNYQRYGQRLGIDLACNPERAEEPYTSMAIACLYWVDKRLNSWADQDNIRGTSNGVNRGNPASTKDPNGFDHRKAALARAKKAFGL